VTQESWEERYSQPDHVWSGKVNHWLAEIAGDLAPGRALDLACGEGGDALWLAGRGWQVTAVDFAASALQRGAAQAEATGLADRITWLQADLGAGWQPPGTFDLVTMQFLHTPANEARDAALRAAWAATSGTLLVVAHDPSNLTEGSGGGPPDPAVLYGPAEVLAALGLAAGDPAVAVAETRRRESASGSWVDAVVVVRRDHPGG
jgi:SAM-dependent methyltransferase